MISVRFQADPSDAYCLDLAVRHYENFPVISRLTPSDVRLDLARIYAFARGADDRGDEARDAGEALRRLDEWEDHLYEMYAGRPTHPVFISLARSVAERALPPEPFLRLIAAFRRDQMQARYETFDDLLSYCRDSADPVGHLVLRVIGVDDPEARRFSDAACTALQLTNFLADVPIDWRKGRLYLPLDDLETFGLSETDVAAAARAGGLPAPTAERWRAFAAFERNRIRRLFEAGLGLLPLLPRRHRAFVGLFSAGGMCVLERAAEADVFAGRPTLRRRDAPVLAARALGWALRPSRSAGRPGVRSPGRAAAPGLEPAYAHCERVLRARAGNFHPALRLLDANRRRALAAAYAFARIADDAVDGEETAEEKWRAIVDWRGAFDAAWADPASARHPVLIALLDAARRFDLPKGPFDGLLDGCTADISRVRYESFGDLRAYCAQVAGTVGILTARVFGARDDGRAEEMGIAFQLTNILRDVAEDARRGRVYLPLEDLAAYHVRPEDLLSAARPASLAALLAFEAERTRAHYRRAEPILDEVDPETRAPFRALVEIYRALLERTASAGPAALDRRVEVPRAEKARIVLRALWGGRSRALR